MKLTYLMFRALVAISQERYNNPAPSTKAALRRHGLIDSDNRITEAGVEALIKERAK